MHLKIITQEAEAETITPVVGAIQEEDGETIPNAGVEERHTEGEEGAEIDSIATAEVPAIGDIDPNPSQDTTMTGIIEIAMITLPNVTDAVPRDT